MTLALVLAADGVLPKKRPAGENHDSFLLPEMDVGTWNGFSRVRGKRECVKTATSRTEDFRWLARSSLRNTE